MDFRLKTFVSVALLSVQAVTRELISDTLTVIDIDRLDFEREFTFATLQGVPENISGNFIRFAGEAPPNPKKNFTRKP